MCPGIAKNVRKSAVDLTRSIEDTYRRADVLRAVAQALAQAGHVTAAADLAHSIEDVPRRALALCDVAVQLDRADDVIRLRALVAQSWLQAATHQEIWQLLGLAHRFIIVDPALLAEVIGARREALQQLAVAEQGKLGARAKGRCRWKGHQPGLRGEGKHDRCATW